MERNLRTLLFSSLYPSSVRPLHGIFVETRLRELLKLRGIQSRVVAPVPWFWSTHRHFGRYATLAATPRIEVHNGIEVHHPRYLRLPKIGMAAAPIAMAVGAWATLARLQREGFDFDVIDAHYFFPDGVAAALLARWFRKPLAVTARGTDINLIPQHWLPRVLIRWAARCASASIGVSKALVERMAALGVDAARLHVMPNGVDVERFRTHPQSAMRTELGISGTPVVLCVGNLHEHKGQRLVVEAFALLRARWPHATLWLIGDGPDRGALQRLIDECGLGGAARLVGAVPQEDLSRWYSAADTLVLASAREGWPNVLLEAMACGTPVVASSVGGVPEIVQGNCSGRTVVDRTPAAFAAAIEGVLTSNFDRAQVRRYAESFGWDVTSRQQLELFTQLAASV